MNASVYDTLYASALGNLILACAGTVPGYWVSVLLIEKLGRIKLQVIGFAVLTVILVILSAAYRQIVNKATGLFIALYCVGLFAFNFGPNTTTFVLPGEVFPTKIRSTVGTSNQSYSFRDMVFLLLQEN